MKVQALNWIEPPKSFAYVNINTCNSCHHTLSTEKRNKLSASSSYPCQHMYLDGERTDGWTEHSYIPLQLLSMGIKIRGGGKGVFKNKRAKQKVVHVLQYTYRK